MQACLETSHKFCQTFVHQLQHKNNFCLRNSVSSLQNSEHRRGHEHHLVVGPAACSAPRLHLAPDRRLSSPHLTCPAVRRAARFTRPHTHRPLYPHHRSTWPPCHWAPHGSVTPPSRVRSETCAKKKTNPAPLCFALGRPGPTESRLSPRGSRAYQHDAAVGPTVNDADMWAPPSADVPPAWK